MSNCGRPSPELRHDSSRSVVTLAEVLVTLCLVVLGAFLLFWRYGAVEGPVEAYLRLAEAYETGDQAKVMPFLSHSRRQQFKKCLAENTSPVGKWQYCLSLPTRNIGRVTLHTRYGYNEVLIQIDMKDGLWWTLRMEKEGWRWKLAPDGEVELPHGGQV